MRAIIDSINIYGAEEEHRYIKLTGGVNIITGDSKTGKSALLEIVDYCLFSKTSSIPKGIITDFSSFYAIVFKFDGGYIILGRPSPKTGKSSQGFFKFETDEAMVTPLKKSYFSKLIPMTLKSAQEKFENYLGLSVKDTNSDLNGFNQGKASIRNATPFFFQHQNLIANKHALFYRFHDFIKRDRTIKELPIFLGWVGGDYYRLIRELDENNKKIKSLDRLASHNEKHREENKNNIISLMSEYLSLIDYKIKEKPTYAEVLHLSENLPPLPENPLTTSNYENDYQINLNKLSDLNTQLSIVIKKIAALDNSSDLSVNHALKLNKLSKRFKLSSIDHKIKCPLCNTIQSEIKNEIIAIAEHQKKLLSNIDKLKEFHQDSSVELEKLRKERTNLRNEIKIVKAKNDEHEKNRKEISNLKSNREKASFIKGKVEMLVSIYNKNNKIINKNDELDEIKERNKLIRKKLEKYDLQKNYDNAESSLSSAMTNICKMLDFEDELKPANLFFSLRTFDFYHTHNGEKIRLHEMGSGANWLACHLSLFLGMLYLIVKEKKSCIPTFLFLDQPSQVYFPSGKNQSDLEDSDIKQVQNIFNVINKVIKGIKKRYDHEPQVIILEHADKLDLEEDYESLVRKRWKENGEKLI